MIDLTPIIQAAISLLAAVITVFIIPYIKDRTNQQQREKIFAWINIAVTAAEQIYAGAQNGGEKKAYVQNFLAERGFKLDESAIDAMIEAAVYKLREGS